MRSTPKKTIEFLVEEKKADFIFTVKRNQPTVFNTIDFLRLAEAPFQFQTIDKGHGRHETRTIWTSTQFVKNIPLPHVQQFFTIKREVVHLNSGKTTLEFAHGITSLSPEKASPQQILDYNRGHWSIENKSHYVRDVTFDEDRSQVRSGKGPQMMAFMRNFVIGLIRLAGLPNIAFALRDFAAQPWKALHFLGL
jgi:hypothetical protein